LHVKILRTSLHNSNAMQPVCVCILTGYYFAALISNDLFF